MAAPISLPRLLHAWDRVRPLPRPRYARNTPRVADAFPQNVYRTPNTQTLAAAATSPEAAAFVADLIAKLTADEELEGQRAFYLLSSQQFGPYMRYADLTTTLWAASTLIQPGAYLEIGVRRGRSACVVGALRPGCAIYGFDRWARYGGKETPGPDFVRSELQNVGHHGAVELVSGDSAETVPAFLAEHPGLFFDLINVDGDHTLMGAARDLASVLPRLKVGGILVFDDITRSLPLRTVWNRVVRSDSRFATWEYTDDGDGVAAAIRIGERPMLHWLADAHD